MPKQETGWLSSSVEERVAEEGEMLSAEDVAKLISESDILCEKATFLYEKYKTKHLSDVIVYLQSVENSLNQLL